MTPLYATHLPLPGRRQGKVRDLYELAPERPGEPGRLLIVATDRISAFDVVMPTPIPGKGRLLTEIAAAWFTLVAAWGVAAHHVLSLEPPEGAGLSAEEQEMLRGRVMVTRRCRVIPVEFVVRGYLEGSGWKEYEAGGSVCGVVLPRGLRRGDRLPQPVFTPATKEEVGKHDENIDFERACAIAGREVMERLREVSLAVYTMAHAYAAERGVILADTKFEFGYPVDARGEPTGEPPILIDEILTPDSSRYWPAEKWSPGKEQESFDKQFLREYLLRLVAEGKWDKQAPGPGLPEEVVRGTVERYEEARRRLFG